MARLCKNDSCNPRDCKYGRLPRIADITLGDFWGIGSNIPFEHDISSGVSSALINTEKGAKLFEAIKPQIFYEERTLEEAIAGNAQLNAPSPQNQYYDLFLELYKKYGFNKAINDCFEKMKEQEIK